MSRFVAGGTLDKPIERDDEWIKAQQELEENRRRKEEEGRQEGGKSLYEILQANKAAKQEAFEEAARLKNQFRALDEDEAEFLDAVLESTRAKEAAIRKETTEQLEIFRKHQEEAEKAAFTEDTVDNAAAEGDQWALSGRKRKKGKEKEPFKGVKLRKSSSTSEQVAASKTVASPNTKPTMPTKLQHVPDLAKSTSQASPKVIVPTIDPPTNAQPRLEKPASPLPQQPGPVSLGLASYSSDEDD